MLRFCFRSSAICPAFWPKTNHSSYFRLTKVFRQGKRSPTVQARALPKICFPCFFDAGKARPVLADENGGHGRGLVGELACKDHIPRIQGVFGLLDEAPGSVVLRAPPSRTIPADQPCKDRDGIRIIAYDASFVVLGKEFKDRSVEFCVDASGSIRNTTYVDY